MARQQISPGVYWDKPRSVIAEDGAEIRYTVLGDEDGGRGPTVVLLSGFLCPDTWWYHLTPALLRAGYRIVMLHYRGIATSGLPRVLDSTTISVPRFAQDVLDVLHAAGVREAALIGHSMGGQVMIEVARRTPNRISAMVSVTATYRSPTLDLYGRGWLVNPLSVHLLRGLRLLREPLGTATWRTLWRTVPFLPLGRAVTAFNSRTPADIIASYEAHAATLSGEYFIASLNAMHAHDATDVLPDLPIPTLVITGDADPFTPPAVARRMVELLPQAELLVVADASHGAILEHPELINDAILAHLSSTTGHLLPA